MAKDIVSAYRNVCRDLKGLEAYKIISKNRLNQAHQVVMKGKMPSSIMCYVPLDRALEDYNLAVDDYNETVESIESLTIAKMQMEQIIGTMSDAEQVVILMHVEQGKNLKEIAKIANYSHGYLRRVASAIGKKEVTQSAS